jgi:hypothetical protein
VGESGGIPHLAKNERDVGHPAVVARLQQEPIPPQRLLTHNLFQLKELPGRKQQVPPLRFAPVGMTILFWPQ